VLWSSIQTFILTYNNKIQWMQMKCISMWIYYSQGVWMPQWALYSLWQNYNTQLSGSLSHCTHIIHDHKQALGFYIVIDITKHTKKNCLVSLQRNCQFRIRLLWMFIARPLHHYYLFFFFFKTHLNYFIHSYISSITHYNIHFIWLYNIVSHYDGNDISNQIKIPYS